MPDLTIETIQHCGHHSMAVSATVQGSKGETYQVRSGLSDNHCDCMGFRWSKKVDWRERRTCKHIEKLQNEACSWSEHHGTGQTDWQAKYMICPDCGEKTHWVRVGV